MQYLISIDVGIVNLGICVFDFTCAKYVLWDNISLVPNGRYMPAQNVQYVRNLVTKYHTYFDNAAQIVVERQMRCNMRIIEAVINAMFYDRCTVINARSVKLHYGLSMKNYKLNKERAVAWAREFVRNNELTAFLPGTTARFKAGSKQDDLADALLLCMYYLDTYSNQLENNTEFDGFL